MFTFKLDLYSDYYSEALQVVAEGDELRVMNDLNWRKSYRKFYDDWDLGKKINLYDRESYDETNWFLILKKHI